MSDNIKGVKAFNRNMTCRGFQFEEGKTYTHDGLVKACESGFHFCENPIDTFRYYEPVNSVFREVYGSGDIDRNDDDTKVAVSEITIGAEISLRSLIDMGVKFFFSRKYTEEKSNLCTGYSSAASVTGDGSAASVTGDRSAASVTGYSSAASVTGYSSAAVCTGLEGKAMAGKFGCIALAWWNNSEKRHEMRCAETGIGDGSDGKLKAETWYSLSDAGEFVETEG